MAIFPLYKEDVLEAAVLFLRPSVSQVGWLRGGIHSGPFFILWDSPQVCEMCFV